MERGNPLGRRFPVHTAELPDEPRRYDAAGSWTTSTPTRVGGSNGSI